MCTECKCSKMKVVLEVGYTTVWMYEYLPYWAVHLRMVKVVYFMLCMHFTIFLKGKTKHRALDSILKALSGTKNFHGKQVPESYWCSELGTTLRTNGLRIRSVTPGNTTATPGSWYLRTGTHYSGTAVKVLWDSSLDAGLVPWFLRH